MNNTNRCPKCGGEIVVESLGEYGIVYKLKKDGSEGKKIRKINYGSNGEFLYYCTSCGENYERKDIIERKEE